MICLDRVGFAIRASFMSVAMYPGAMPVTLIPLDAHSLERALIYHDIGDNGQRIEGYRGRILVPRDGLTIPQTPCLAAAYAGTVKPPADMQH